MADVIKKPAHGDPCNGCGFCCRVALCSLARDLFASARWEEPTVPGPCPALEEGPDGRAACGLVVCPATYFPVKVKRNGSATLQRAALELIGSEIGCDAQKDDEPDNAAFIATMERHRLARANSIRAARDAWGVPHW